MSYNIKAPNFTQVPNVIFDYWMPKFDHCTIIILLYLCRKTFGWHKVRDRLSLSKIQEATKMSRPTVIKSLKILEDNGLVKKEMHTNEMGGQDPNTYELIIHEIEGEGSQIDLPPSKIDLPPPSKEDLPPLVKEIYTQKKDIQNKEQQEREKRAREEKEKDMKVHGTFVKFTDSDYDALCKKWGKEKVEEIIESINDHCANNRPKGYDDYVAAFRTFHRNQNKTQGSKHGAKNKGKLNDGKTEETRGVFINGVRIE
jgi:DNA-binding transcriptional ArsR family regulator